MGIVIVSTYPDKKSISKVAHIVVEKKLAACVNYTKINSVYTWKGKTENAKEFLALFKTTAKSKQKLKEEITKSHPYDVPEIVELKMDSVSLPYLRWLEQSTLGKKPTLKRKPTLRKKSTLRRKPKKRHHSSKR